MKTQCKKKRAIKKSFVSFQNESKQNFLNRIRCFYPFFSGIKSKATPFIQCLLPVVSFGPSSKTCPKCPPQVLHFSSVLA